MEQLLAGGKWREMLRSDVYQERTVCFAVDEAHCVIKWYVHYVLLALLSDQAYMAVIRSIRPIAS